jgi:diaminohydroxyphosphoribosylaminopyrimidine deaminase/5-amino-6-(5-phosphoribosylamino)uracil reductase
MTRFMRIAEKVAQQSNHPQHKLGCVIVKGGKVISKAANNSPGRGHAEQRAVRPHNNFVGCCAYVARINGKKTSMPCPKCMEVLKKAGIKTVIFYGQDGTVTSLDCDRT